jgi:prepilin-type processing-associated H-X9-DG protein
MKQIGLALHNYHQAFDCFPPGALGYYNTAGTFVVNFSPSAHVRLLGTIEQSGLYNASNFSIGWANYAYGEYANSTVIVSRLNVFLCPSDRFTGYPTPASFAATAPMMSVPGNSYYASHGSSLEWSAQSTGGPPNGPFYQVGNMGPHCASVRDVQDGTSNTAAFGEWRIGSGNSNVVTMPTDIIYVGTYPANTARNDGTLIMPNPKLVAGFLPWAASCAANVGNPADRYAVGNTVMVGAIWAVGLPGFSQGNLLLPPNSKYPNCTVSTAGNHSVDLPGIYNPSSYHPGGANILMCDGSVRFLKDSTSMQTIWALGSIAQGEVLSADSY